MIAILRDEPEARSIAKALKNARRKLLAAPTYVETSMVIAGRKALEGKAELDRLLAETGIEIVAFDAGAARAAVNAFIRYGKGRHPAGLNFGDWMSYALARTELMPLLFKGDDFRMTDVEVAL